MAKKRVLAGMRPTGELHLGNYLGSAKGMIDLQEEDQFETLYMVADLHAITTPYDKDLIKEQTLGVVKDYIAAGLDPEKSTLFVQSHVPEHLSLFYLFSTVLTVARMNHLPTYKEKVKQYPQSASMALLNYPVLMSADILIYRAHLVPVGIDQEPHIEVAREVARKMNDIYMTNFPEPERYVTEGEYVPSLTGEGKMSKSIPGSYISLGDSLGEIKKKLARVPTDSGKGEKVPQEGGVAVLLDFVTYFQGEDRTKDYIRQYKGGGIKYREMKEELAGAIHRELAPMQVRRRELEEDPGYIEEVLRDGAQKARKIAQGVASEVKEKMGLMQLK